MWTHETTLHWGERKHIPVPVFKDEHGRTIKLLPCNPDKQTQYPDFVGYLIYDDHRRAITREGARYKISECPKDVPAETLRAMIAVAEADGHVFPPKQQAVL